jgi:signal recognition particle subunit SRP54
MLVGLNGAGKTTTTGKLARWLGAERGRRPYLASLDVYRPAAIEQLRILGEQLSLPVHPTPADGDPVRIARDAVAAATAQGADVVLLDTAGRQTVDEGLMLELERVRAAVEPRQILLVADAMTGQDAVATAEGFSSRLPLTGVILTKIEGDARGGAALSLRSVKGKPILFAGTGEKLDALEPFTPIASRPASWGWATPRSSSGPRRPTIATRPRRSRRSSRRTSSTWKTSRSSSPRSRRWVPWWS